MSVSDYTSTVSFHFTKLIWFDFQATTRRQLSQEDLSQMYRSAGCVNDEIQLACRGGNIHDSVIIIENATFYSLPSDDEGR